MKIVKKNLFNLCTHSVGYFYDIAWGIKNLLYICCYRQRWKNG